MTALTAVRLFGLSHVTSSVIGIEPVFSEDWLLWRGPNGNGVAAESATPLQSWSEEEGVKWKAIVPGRGHASPIVVGDLVLIATATADGQFALAYDREDGSIRWKQRIHEGGVPTKLHRKNTAASATPASDGENLFFLFHNKERLVLTALDMAGEILWQKDTGKFVCDFD
ncbi:MAG: PQQ-binding-like beta-propeller repeat protein, partial [Verrucomicrobiota bacterium]